MLARSAVTAWINSSRHLGQIPWVVVAELAARSWGSPSPGSKIPHQAHTRIHTGEDPESTDISFRPFGEVAPCVLALCIPESAQIATFHRLSPPGGEMQ